MSNWKNFNCKIELKYTGLKFHLANMPFLNQVFKKIDCKQNSFSTKNFNLIYIIGFNIAY